MTWLVLGAFLAGALVVIVRLDGWLDGWLHRRSEARAFDRFDVFTDGRWRS